MGGLRWLVLGALSGALLVVQVGGEYEYYADGDGEEDVKDIQYYNYYNEVRTLRRQGPSPQGPPPPPPPSHCFSQISACACA